MTSPLSAPDVIHDPAKLAALTAELRASGRRIVLVPTMGALHEGHLTLVRRAQELVAGEPAGDVVGEADDAAAPVIIVSIFVNPLQFGPGEDYDAYPRTLEDDIAKLTETGVDIVFAPAAKDMYPHGFRTTVNPGPLATELEGATRPGHFAGALTVCAKLFGLSHCTDAMFGEKDYQQFTLLQQMVDDLNLPLTLHPVPIVRADNHLALSSRNRYLSDDETSVALSLSRALAAGQKAAGDGASAAHVLAAARNVLAAQPGVEVDYVELRAADLTELPELSELPERGGEAGAPVGVGAPADAAAAEAAVGAAPTEARLLLAAKVGTTRLIDNCAIWLHQPQEG